MVLGKHREGAALVAEKTPYGPPEQVKRNPRLIVQGFLTRGLNYSGTILPDTIPAELVSGNHAFWACPQQAPDRNAACRAGSAATQ